ncbi:MAG: response regulator [Myxococcales bacterium]|nr:response regulator [Myxococcales bacterium]
MGQSWNEADMMTSVMVCEHAGEHQEPRACIVHVSERGSKTYTRILDREELTIGRGSICSVQISCSHISRVHAKIIWADGGWIITDNKSANGILVNGVKQEAAKLQFGDRLDLGRGEVILFRPYDSDYQRVLEAQKLESLGRLASGIAHDFNNVLMAIVGATSCLAEDFEQGDVVSIEETTRDIMTASERGADLARQLLSFAQQGKQANDLVGAADVALEVTRLIQRTFDQRIRVHSDTASRALVVAERGQLVQVLMNLCINARDAMPHGGNLTIEVSDESPKDSDATGSYVCMRVRDTGMGMSHEVRERVFEPFFSTRGEGHGTGLGMATTYGIVKNYGGKIDIQSKVGEGTCVSVYLPCQHASPVHEVASGSAAEDSKTGAIAPRGQGRYILLAEDQPLVRRHTCRLLRRLGFEVIEAHDGVEAVELLENSTVPICMALLDLQMPRRSGDEACLMMKSIDAELPIIMVSGNVEDPRIEALVQSNNVDVLAKPFGADELARVLTLARS